MPINKRSIIQLAAVLFLLIVASCSASPGLQGTPSLTPEVAVTASPTSTISRTPVSTPTATRTAAPTSTLSSIKTETPTLLPSSAPAAACGYVTVTQQIIDSTSPEAWMGWVKKLSGVEPVQVGGKRVTITTRFSPALFSGQTNARAFDFVLEQVRGWYPEGQIEVMPYAAVSRDGKPQGTWKNLILTLPGHGKPEEMVILSAHLDSNVRGAPEQVAPGAEDNASGSATLLEAARIFRDYQFERTIQIIWFTGEEQGLLGSKAFVEHVKDPKAITGVINLDMFGYDSDSDRCFELHVGDLPQSDIVGQCFARSIDAYALGLPRFDYVTKNAVHGSDHSSFWNRGIGAVEILENMFNNNLASAGQPDACANADPDPNYHSPEDTYDKLNPDSAIRIARAALAAAAGLAGPIEPNP